MLMNGILYSVHSAIRNSVLLFLNRNENSQNNPKRMPPKCIDEDLEAVVEV